MFERASTDLKADDAKNHEGVLRKPQQSDVRQFSNAYESPRHLQRYLGNQAVRSLFKSAGIQAKLTIGQPDDIHEQEADRVADQVMRMPDPAAQLKPVNITPLVQRQEKEEEEDEPLQMVQRQADHEEEDEKPLQLKGQSSQLPGITSQLESSINSFRGGGQPLDADARAFFEPRFGCDFGQVRVHSDAHAVGAAEAINARAFTLGGDIVFGADQYSPGSAEGNRLLAHELTHVAQQSGNDQFPSSMRRQIKDTFTEEEFAPVREAFYANKRGREEARESCISIVNTGLRALFKDKKMKLGGTMEETMSRLQAMSFADAPIEIGFLNKQGKPTNGTIEPETLEESVQARILAMTGDEPLVYLFGMSIMDGYHSALLAVDNYFVPEPKGIYWMDQIYSGYDYINGELDGRITSLTKSWWNKEADGLGKTKRKIRMDTTVRIWPIVVRLRGDYSAPADSRPA